jgi:hypothetical protein
MSEIDGLRHNITHVHERLHKTDIYLDRYQPLQYLNILNDVMTDSITDYDGRKEFCEQIQAKFEVFKKKIRRLEKIDAMVTNKLHLQCDLKKEFYRIPVIEIPPTLSFQEEEEEEEESDDFGSGDEWYGEQDTQGQESPT